MNRQTMLTLTRLRNAAVAVVGLALLVILGFALNTLFASRSEQSSVSNIQSQPRSLQQSYATPNPAGSQTTPSAGWNDYINDKDGYAIKYPGNWYLNKNSSIITSYDPQQAPGKAGVPSSEFKVWIVVVDNPSSLTVKDWLEKALLEDKNSITVTEKRKLQVGGVEGILLTGHRPSNPRQTVTSVYLTQSDKVYKIHFYPGNSRYFETFLEMLSTFRFSTG